MTTSLIFAIITYWLVGTAMIFYLMCKAFELDDFQTKKDVFWWWSMAVFIGIFWLPFSMYVFIKDFAVWLINLPDE